jgi:hypothetical protein
MSRSKLLVDLVSTIDDRPHGQHYRIELTPDETGAKVVARTWERTPVSGTQLTPRGLLSAYQRDELGRDDPVADLHHADRPGSGLPQSEVGIGAAPIYHHKEDRAEGHLFITVLAYQAVQALRRKLKAKGIKASWTTLREIFSTQQRVTATFKQRDGRTLHVRKTTVAEPKLQRLYTALDLTADPVGVRKLIN